MPASALDSATDLVASLSSDPRRSRRQVITFGLVGGLLFVMAIALIPAAVGSWGLWFLVGGLLLLVALLAWAAVGLLRNPARRLVGVSPRGMLVPLIAEPVPWGDIAWLSAVRYPNRVSVGAAGRIASSATAAGGLNDGGRDLNIVLKDAESWRGRLGSHSYLVGKDLTWEEKGAQGFKLPLSAGADAASFESFVLALKNEADARGIPILISSR